MTANERREEIIKNLVKEKKAITGSELASPAGGFFFANA